MNFPKRSISALSRFPPRISAFDPTPPPPGPSAPYLYCVDTLVALPGQLGYFQDAAAPARMQTAIIPTIRFRFVSFLQKSMYFGGKSLFHWRKTPMSAKVQTKDLQSSCLLRLSRQSPICRVTAENDQGEPRTQPGIKRQTARIVKALWRWREWQIRMEHEGQDKDRG